MDSKNVLEIIKRNGEFDKYRKEVLDKIVESDEMKACIEKCHSMVRAEMTKKTDGNHIITPTDITILRQIVKERIKREKIIQPLQVCCRQYLNSYDQTFGDLIEGVARAAMGLPAKDSNIELVDMEVSSGSSPSVSMSSSSSSSSSSNFDADEMDLTLAYNSDSKLSSSLSTPTPTLIKEDESSLDGSSELSESLSSGTEEAKKATKPADEDSDLI